MFGQLLISGIGLPTNPSGAPVAVGSFTGTSGAVATLPLKETNRELTLVQLQCSLLEHRVGMHKTLTSMIVYDDYHNVGRYL